MFKQKIIRFFTYVLITLGSIFFLMIVLAFTRIPFDWHYSLGAKTAAFNFTPDYIIMLGSGGMPDEQNLIRLYYTAAYADEYPEAKIIVTHPKDTVTVNLMLNELYNRHIDTVRISTELRGTNTRAQALTILEDYKGIESKNVLLLTSTENVYRTLQTFRKAGFKNVGGKPAFENAMHVNLKYDHKGMGGKVYVPDVSGDLTLRYNFWNYLKLEITCFREWMAIAYYKLNGWI